MFHAILLRQPLQLRCLKVLVFSTTSFHLTLAWMRFVQLFIFIILKSSFISFSHLVFGLPNRVHEPTAIFNKKQVCFLRRPKCLRTCYASSRNLCLSSGTLFSCRSVQSVFGLMALSWVGCLAVQSQSQGIVCGKQAEVLVKESCFYEGVFKWSTNTVAPVGLLFSSCIFHDEMCHWNIKTVSVINWRE